MMDANFATPTKEFLMAIQARGKPHIRVSNQPGLWLCHDHELIAWDESPAEAFWRWKGFRESENITKEAIARSTCVPGNGSIN